MSSFHDDYQSATITHGPHRNKGETRARIDGEHTYAPKRMRRCEEPRGHVGRQAVPKRDMSHRESEDRRI